MPWPQPAYILDANADAHVNVDVDADADADVDVDCRLPSSVEGGVSSRWVWVGRQALLLPPNCHCASLVLISMHCTQ